MKIKRKKEEKPRTEKDKSWDSVYGAGAGGAAGAIGSTAIYKGTKKLRNTTSKSINDHFDNISKKIDEESLKGIKDPTDLPGKIFAGPVDESNAGMGEYNINAGKHNLNNAARKKALRKLKIKKRLAYSGIVAAPIIGSVLGSLYGRDNDLRKQRRKMEEAAGDKVAESIKGIGKKKK